MTLKYKISYLPVVVEWEVHTRDDIESMAESYGHLDGCTFVHCRIICMIIIINNNTIEAT